jgi:hypothetical protein
MEAKYAKDGEVTVLRRKMDQVRNFLYYDIP